MATSDAPISIGSVTLVVNDLNKVSEFYRSVVGLNEISSDALSCTLGQDNNVLLKLVKDASARHLPGEAGLFHTAFLLPDRASLGAWFKSAKANRTRLDGVADHGVSEAIYLTDPEGNGVEIYADRDRSEWNIMRDGEIDIFTKPLRTTNLLKAATAEWTGAPDGTVIGHVHLQVGEIKTADEFYIGELGFQAMAQMESASFYGTGGYHHHLAGNIWHSRGAKQRSKNATGLLEVELLVSDASASISNAVDPWGTHFKFTDRQI